jgi:hypothetical protein
MSYRDGRTVTRFRAPIALLVGVGALVSRDNTLGTSSSTLWLPSDR